MSLSHADALHVEAAQGWLDLNNSLEAADELAMISSVSRLHPDALGVEWIVLAAGTKWEAGLSLADAITIVVPERASGWIMKSFALRGLDRIQEAFDGLFQSQRIFNLSRPLPMIGPATLVAWGEWAKLEVGWRKPEKQMEDVSLRQLCTAIWI